jgi:hypothetical protein
LDGGGAGLDLTPPTGPAQCRHQLGLRQRPTQLRGRRQPEHGDRVAAAGVTSEGSHRGRVEGPQRAAQHLGLSLAGPDQLLVAAG